METTVIVLAIFAVWSIGAMVVLVHWMRLFKSGAFWDIPISEALFAAALWPVVLIEAFLVLIIEKSPSIEKRLTRRGRRPA